MKCTGLLYFSASIFYFTERASQDVQVLPFKTDVKFAANHWSNKLCVYSKILVNTSNVTTELELVEKEKLLLLMILYIHINAWFLPLFMTKPPPPNCRTALSEGPFYQHDAKWPGISKWLQHSFIAGQVFLCSGLNLASRKKKTCCFSVFCINTIGLAHDYLTFVVFKLKKNQKTPSFQSPVHW